MFPDAAGFVGWRTSGARRMVLVHETGNHMGLSDADIDAFDASVG
jgi:predicted Zn-dependent protease with MMP-like domain